MDHTKTNNTKNEQSHLDLDESEIVGDAKVPERAGILEVYKFVGAKYIIILIIATINTIIAGVSVPLKFLVIREIFGKMEVDRPSHDYTGTLRC